MKGLYSKQLMELKCRTLPLRQNCGDLLSALTKRNKRIGPDIPGNHPILYMLLQFMYYVCFTFLVKDFKPRSY